METQTSEDGAPEREWQLDADDLRAVSRRLRGAPLAEGFTVGVATTRQLTDTYYDTDDWRFHRAGYALRVRRTRARIEATLKAFGDRREGLQRRLEISEPLARPGADELVSAPGPVGTRVRAVAGHRPIAALFEVHTRRRAQPLRHAGRAVGEIALDRTSIPRPGGEEPARLSRVEVEVGAAASAEVEPFVAALRTSCRLHPTATSKYAAGLHAHGLAPASVPDLGSTVVDDAMATGAVALAALRGGFASLLAHEPGTRLGEDVEALHEMRVATRRLRAAIKLFAEALPVRARALRGGLGWLGSVLGAVRDLDVELAQLDAWREDLDADDRPALGPVAVLLRERREAARRRMLRAFDSRRYERFVAAAVDVVRRGPGRTPAAQTPILAAAPDLIGASYRKLRKMGDRIDAASDALAYHQLRIRGKRLRYALEFHEDVYGKPLRATLRALVALQKILGGYHDAEVAAGHLRELCAMRGRRLPPRTLFVLGALAEREGRRARKLRRRAVKVYRKLAWRRLRQAMDGRRPAPAVDAKPARPRRGPRRDEGAAAPPGAKAVSARA